METLLTFYTISILDTDLQIGNKIIIEVDLMF